MNFHSVTTNIPPLRRTSPNLLLRFHASGSFHEGYILFLRHRDYRSIVGLLSKARASLSSFFILYGLFWGFQYVPIRVCFTITHFRIRPTTTATVARGL